MTDATDTTGPGAFPWELDPEPGYPDDREMAEGLPFGPALPRPRTRKGTAGTGPGELPREVPPPGSLDRIRLWATQTLAPAITTIAARQGTLADSQPPTFRQARARHHECAGHYTNWLARGQRLVYGYLHMALIKPALNYAEWATESELRAVIHVLLAAAVWLGLLLGGQL